MEALLRKGIFIFQKSPKPEIWPNISWINSPLPWFKLIYLYITRVKSGLSWEPNHPFKNDSFLRHVGRLIPRVQIYNGASHSSVKSSSYLFSLFCQSCLQPFKKCARWCLATSGKYSKTLLLRCVFIIVKLLWIRNKVQGLLVYSILIKINKCFQMMIGWSHFKHS